MKTRLMLAAMILVLLLAACTPKPTGEVVLTLTGLTETKTFTLADLQKLPITEGYAGTKSSTGKITVPELYRGVLLTDLLDEVDGLKSDQAIQITAEDGYAMTFSPDQVANGEFITYDPGTGDEIAAPGPLQVLLAYERAGAPLNAEEEGALRLMVISPEGNQIVDGHWAIKWVSAISYKPLTADWNLELTGAITDTVDRGTFESCSTGACHQAEWTDDKAQTWTGVPLWELVGRVDDETKHGDDAFSDDAASAGYTVDVISADGYIVTLDSAAIQHNDNILVAYQVNGNVLTDEDFPLRLVGTDLSKKEMAGGLVQIVVNFGAAPVEPTATTAPEPTATTAVAQPTNPDAALTIKGLVTAETAWTMDELHGMEVVTLNVVHPKKGDQTAEGVRLNALLDLAGFKPEAATLVITASDGYIAEAALADVRACADCLIAFNESGQLKSVMPGFESSFWVKDVVSIEVK